MIKTKQQKNILATQQTPEYFDKKSFKNVYITPCILKKNPVDQIFILKEIIIKDVQR